MSDTTTEAVRAEPGAQASTTRADDEAPKQRAKTKSKRRRYLLIFFLLCAVIAAIAGGWYWYGYASRYVSTDDAFIDGQVVRLSPQIAGELVSVDAPDNSHVEAGQILAKIDPSQIEAQLAQRQAQLSSAQTGVGEAEAQLASAQAEVQQQQAALDAAQTRSRNASQLASRYGDLVSQQAISRQQSDDASADAQEASASVEQAQARLASAQAGVQSAQAKLNAAKAEVEGAKADLKAAQVQQSYLQIKAPIAGFVTQKNVNVGSYVSPGSQMMAIVPDDLYVTANFKETDLSGIEVGASVDVEVDAYPDTKYHGTVQSIQRGAGQAFQLLPPQNATGNFVKVVQRVPVRISIDPGSSAQRPLGPGMSVVPYVHRNQ